MSGNYYDVLGVPSSASPEEIKTHYLRLMRRFHPDRNRSPLAHARTADINEAYHFLSDPDLRTWHDAQLAVRQQEAAAARALDLSLRGGRALVRRRRRTLLQRYGAQLALAGLLTGTGVAGWQIEQRLVGTGGAIPSPESYGPDSKTQGAVKALEAATARDAGDMPPISTDAVARGISAYRRLSSNGGLAQARAYSEQCLPRAAEADNWGGLDLCVAFDQAAFAGIDSTPNASARNIQYFIDRHDRAAHLYVTRVSSLDAIDDRLDRIRAAVGPRSAPPRVGTARVLHGISKHGWQLAGAAWHAFDSPDPKQGANPHAKDF